MLVVVSKALNGLAPTYIADLLTSPITQRSLRSSSQNLLAVPRARLKLKGDRAFLCMPQDFGIVYQPILAILPLSQFINQV